jgi:transposase-like protein
MSHPVPAERGPNLPYTRASFDWQPLFDLHSRPEKPLSLLAIARRYNIPKSTLYDHWRQYQSALAANDELELAKARGDIDGRRDNHRVFSREEEDELKEALNQENVQQARRPGDRAAHPPGAREGDQSRSTYQVEDQVCCSLRRLRPLRASRQAGYQAERQEGQSTETIQAASSL